MNNCPCCSTPMLRHARHSKIYWYCPQCKEEMPNLGDWMQTQTFFIRHSKQGEQVSIRLSSHALETTLSEREAIKSI